MKMKYNRVYQFKIRLGLVNHRSDDGYKIIKDPQHDEYEEMLEWLGGDDFDPEYFDVNAVNFSDPDKRLRMGFE
jgi:hypothetical protein